LRAIGLLAYLEHAPQRSLRFWIGSQFAIYDAARLARMDTPWWSMPAIDAVERWIAERNGQVRVFEYGAGASTAWLARRCSQVISVEHDAEFARGIAPVLERDNVSLRLVEPQRSAPAPMASSGRRGYEDCDFSAYVNSIADTDGYDLIVIDGRARAACLARAQEHLNAGGLIVFDNSNRRRYQAALNGVTMPLLRYRGWAPALPYRSETALIGATKEYASA
jgi:predicted O-methyltransferase YrrM